MATSSREPPAAYQRYPPTFPVGFWMLFFCVEGPPPFPYFVSLIPWVGAEVATRMQASPQTNGGGSDSKSEWRAMTMTTVAAVRYQPEAVDPHVSLFSAQPSGWNGLRFRELAFGSPWRCLFFDPIGPTSAYSPLPAVRGLVQHRRAFS